MNRRNFLKSMAALIAAPVLAVKALDAAERDAAVKRAMAGMINFQNEIFRLLDESKIDFLAPIPQRGAHVWVTAGDHLSAGDPVRLDERWTAWRMAGSPERPAGLSMETTRKDGLARIQII